MRKKISVLASIGITVLMLVACGSTNNSSSPSPEVPNGNPNSSSTTEQIQNDKIENDNSTIPPNQEEDKKPNGYNGKTENLIGDGFSNIKVPVLNEFNDNSFDSNKLDAFEFENMPSEWGDAWWNAYEDFLVANGSPVGNDGKPLPAFNAIHTGKTNGYQYLYYGYMGDTTNGVGDINIYPAAMYPGWSTSKVNKEDFADAYFFDIAVDYTLLETRYVNDYRSASLMMLSWICPNPSEVEKVFYDFLTDESCQDPISKLIIEKGGTNHWLQVGNVDVCLMYYNTSNGECQFAIREHSNLKNMTFSKK